MKATRAQVIKATNAVRNILQEAGLAGADLTVGTLSDALRLAQATGKAGKRVTVQDVLERLVAWHVLAPSMWGFRLMEGVAVLHLQ